MTVYEALKNVRTTLETISVSGKSNMDKLLGCILTVENICNEMERAAAENDGNGERQDGNG